MSQCDEVNAAYFIKSWIMYDYETVRAPLPRACLIAMSVITGECISSRREKVIREINYSISLSKLHVYPCLTELVA